MVQILGIKEPPKRATGISTVIYFLPDSTSVNESRSLSRLISKMNFYVAFILIMSLTMVRGAPMPTDANSEVDCDTMRVELRELYNILMENGVISGLHDMVRKSDRIPSLRLRFGKRSFLTDDDDLV